MMTDNTMNEPLDGLDGEASELVFDLMAIIEDFTQTYFNDEYEVLKFNINFLESNGFAYQKKVDYMKLNRFIAATDREILQDAGRVTAEIAKAHAESEFEKYRIAQDRIFESDFDKDVKKLFEDKKGTTDDRD